MKSLSPLEQAIQFIEKHLYEDIRLCDVAEEIGYSYYHMTRLFSTMLGEPVGHYIHHRRLYNASVKLVQTDQRIIEIAYECGFASPEAFSRAFKSAYGISPTAYRKAGINLVVHGKKPLVSEDIRHIVHNVTLAPEYVHMDKLQIAGIRGTTSLSDNQLPTMWNAYLRDYKQCLMENCKGYSVCETNQTAYTKDGDVTFTVTIGSSVDNYQCDTEGFAKTMISGGRYAVFTNRGSFFHLFKTYQYIYGNWLTTTKEQLDDREDFEVYERKVSSFEDPQNEVKIYIPIK